jgi:hypothetical protein
MSSEPLFFAVRRGESERVEKVLDAAGIPYEVKLDVREEQAENGACYQGLLYEVAADRAEECRRLMLEGGVTSGLVRQKTTAMPRREV